MEHQKSDTPKAGMLTVLRDTYIVPFYLVGSLNAPTWVDNDNRKHRRNINRLNGALVLALLNFFILLEALKLLGRLDWLPEGRFWLDFCAAAFIAPFCIALAPARGERLIASWHRTSARYRILINTIGISFYMTAAAIFFFVLR